MNAFTVVKLYTCYFPVTVDYKRFRVNEMCYVFMSELLVEYMMNVC